jgi:hypothetical protein
VTGNTAGAREAAIAAALQPGLATVIILEGLSDGSAALAFDAAGQPGASQLTSVPTPQVLRIAPGCLHCSGNLVLRVTLNRVLRHPPARLYIGLATAAHLELLRSWLSEAPYGELLSLQPDIAA